MVYTWPHGICMASMLLVCHSSPKVTQHPNTTSNDENDMSMRMYKCIRKKYYINNDELSVMVFTTLRNNLMCMLWYPARELLTNILTNTTFNVHVCSHLNSMYIYPHHWLTSDLDNWFYKIKCNIYFNSSFCSSIEGHSHTDRPAWQPKCAHPSRYSGVNNLA